jgi:hypothetical protein
MKYLPVEHFEEINASLSCILTGDSRIYGRIGESFC